MLKKKLTSETAKGSEVGEETAAQLSAELTEFFRVPIGM